MTALELYNETLIELNKLNAPTFTLEQWVYMANKAIQAYSDKRYNFYAMNQQLTDDLRVLLSTYRTYNPASTKVDSTATVLGWDEFTSVAINIHVSDILPFQVGDEVVFGDATVVHTITELQPGVPDKIVVSPPVDLNSIADNIQIGDIIYIVQKAFSETSSLSSNAIYSFSLEANNYYHLLAVRTYWTDVRGEDVTTLKCDPNQIKSVTRMFPAKRLTYDMLANIENNAYLKPMYRQPYHQLHDHYLNVGTEKITDTNGQYQNMPEVEVHAGEVPSGITLQMIEVDYLKLPETLDLTDQEVYVNATDESQLLEWPDYLNSELIKHIVSYFIENTMNPRIQTFQAFNEDTPSAPLELGAQQ